MHFLQESYEFVQKLQILQVCYSVEHFLQELLLIVLLVAKG